jgi:glyoxylate reductase
MPRPLVYITRQLPKAAIDIVADTCDYRIWDSEATPVPRNILLREVAEADGILALLTERIDSEFLAAAPKLRIVANMAVGYDNVDLPALTARRVLLTNTPGVLTETTADLAWALLMAASRRIVESHQLVAAGQWGAWSPMFMTGQDIHGSTLGVLGAGRIGSAVLRRGMGFGMQLRYHNRRPSAELEAETGAQYRSFADLFRESDILVVLVPLNNETRGLVGAREFALMKDTAVFVNVSRGPIVNEGALYTALQQGRPWAAGLDVFEKEPISADHPLLTLPNVVAVPHIGSASIATRTRMATTAAQNLAAFLSGREAPNPVNKEALKH